jgi:hypothetical protein
MCCALRRRRCRAAWLSLPWGAVGTVGAGRQGRWSWQIGGNLVNWNLAVFAGVEVGISRRTMYMSGVKESVIR